MANVWIPQEVADNINRYWIKPLSGDDSKFKDRGELFADAASVAGEKSFPKAMIDRELGLHPRHLMSRYLLPCRQEQISRMEGKVFCGVYDQTGNLFLSAAQDSLIRVYDTSGSFFRLLENIPAQDVGWCVLDMDISPSGQHLLYCSFNPVIRLCRLSDASAQDQHHTLEPDGLEDQNIGTFFVRFSADGREAFAGAGDHCLHVYDLERQVETIAVSAHDKDVNAIAVSKNSYHLVISGGDDGLAKVWDRRLMTAGHSEPVGVFTGHLDGITYLDVRDDDRLLVSNSKDQSIKLWDMRRFSPAEGVQEARERSLSSLWDYRWHDVPTQIAQTRDRMRSDTSLLTMRGHSVRQTLIRCHFSPRHSTGQQLIYTGSACGSVFIFDALTGQTVKRLISHTRTCRDVSWHPYFPELLSSSWDGSVVRWSYSGDLSASQ